MLTEDPTVFLADFGEAVTVDGVALSGIYSDPYVDTGVGLTGRAGRQPRVYMPAAGLPARGADDPVVDLPARTPVRYRAREIQPDGTGWVTLILDVHPVQP